jgi:hypothetical protein
MVIVKPMDANDKITDLPRTIVGDGGSPNVFFVTNTNTGKVLAVFVGDDTEKEAIAFADRRSEPLMVEDRQTGVVHDNPASERQQDLAQAAEDLAQAAEDLAQAAEDLAFATAE